MELVDKFTPQDWYKGQRDAIRNAIQDTDSNWYKLIMNLYQLDPGVRKVFFRNFIVNASLKGSARQEEVAAQNNCNVPWAILLDPRFPVTQTHHISSFCLSFWYRLDRRSENLSVVSAKVQGKGDHSGWKSVQNNSYRRQAKEDDE